MVKKNKEKLLQQLTKELKRVDIIMVRHKKDFLLSPIIRFITKSYWNHVALVYVIAHHDKGYDNTFVIDAGRGGVDIHNIKKYLDNPKNYDIGIKRVKAEWFSGETGIEIRRQIRGLLLNEIDARFNVSILIKIARRILGSAIFGTTQLLKVLKTRRQKEPTEVKPGKLTPDSYICSGLAQYSYFKGVQRMIQAENDVIKRKKLQDIIFKPNFNIDKDTEETLQYTTPADFANSDKLVWKFIIKDGEIFKYPKNVDMILKRKI